MNVPFWALARSARSWSVMLAIELFAHRVRT